eukprot:GDKJ01009462.1.p1 GENE.GDKJ01009462.1~~GDKJ01009462.1.p1  ORF type:complete len:529 (-),score=130.90 GDKJ01009462.1:64-1608(-)
MKFGGIFVKSIALYAFIQSTEALFGFGSDSEPVNQFKPFVAERTSNADKSVIRQLRKASMQEFWPLPENQNILIAGHGLQPPSTPVWLMRQAGRYLPEFREVRADVDFVTVCEDPILAAEVTLQPKRRYSGLDAVIVFSDILTVPAAMGMPLSMVPGAGPKFSFKLSTPEDIAKLNLRPDVENTLGYVFDAVFATRVGLTTGLKMNSEIIKGVNAATARSAVPIVPVIGFSGAPWTLFAYMVEGGGSRDGWVNAKTFLFRYPESAQIVLNALSEVVAEYLINQWDSGAQLLQIFDTNAGALSPDDYERWGAVYIRRIVTLIRAKRPQALILGFPLNRPLAEFKNSGLDGLSIGWGDNAEEMRSRFGWDRVFSYPTSSVASKEKESDNLVAQSIMRGCVVNEGRSEDNQIGTESCEGLPRVFKSWRPSRNPSASHPIAVQGNMDPHKLYGDDEFIRREVAMMMGDLAGPGYIANLGHGMEPGMRPEAVAVFIQAVKDYGVPPGEEVVKSLKQVRF